MKSFVYVILNVSAAFLNGELEEEIYLSQSPGFVIQEKENFVCKLKKILYMVYASMV